MLTHPAIPLRAGRLSPRARSAAALAAVLLVAIEMQREAWTAPAAADGRILAALASLVMTAALLARRRSPLAAAAAGFTALLVVDLRWSPWEVIPMLGFATLPLAYAVGRRTTGRRLAVGATLIVATFGLIAARQVLDPATGRFVVGSTVTQVALSAAPLWLGITMRDRAALHAGLEASAARAEAERSTSYERTVLDERARIAGELHDVIAHALSAVVVQASAARLETERGGPGAAAALATVERTGRDALHEMRAMLDVLRGPHDDGSTTLEPQPRIEDLPRLIARASVDAALDVRGRARPLPASVDLTAYRVVQEALDVAAAAGATSARVVIRFEPTMLLLSIEDDGRGDRAQLATRERVRLYGGELQIEARRGSSTQVRARLPVREAAS